MKAALAAFLFKKLSSQSCFSSRCFLCAFSQYRFIFYMFSVAWLSTGIFRCPFIGTAFPRRAARSPCRSDLSVRGVAVHPALLCPSISSTTYSSFPRTVRFKLEGHRKAILLC